MDKSPICSICGQPGATDSSGPGPHRFHGACINGAYNFMALIAESGGDCSPTRMAFWPNAKKAGIKYPFRPFAKPKEPTHV